MAPFAIGFGAALILLGGGMYVYTEMASITALIPAFFGLPLALLGALATNDKFRMHAMHAAALIGLIGFAMPAYMVIAGLARGDEFGLAKGEQTAMAALCGIFLALCIKSFIEIRIARKQKEAQEPKAP
jgi:lysylphosphatidylglycerol synthetase-like protein (DUF2156 family)